MLDIVRDSTIGQILNRVSHGRILPYADQRPDYVIPARYLPGFVPSKLNSITEEAFPRTETGATLVGAAQEKKVEDDSTLENGTPSTGAATAASPATPEYPFLVTWEENDQDNP